MLLLILLLVLMVVMKMIVVLLVMLLVVLLLVLLVVLLVREVVVLTLPPHILPPVKASYTPPPHYPRLSLLGTGRGIAGSLLSPRGLYTCRTGSRRLGGGRTQHPGK